MNKQIEAQEVHLIELLKRIPENAKLIVDSGDGMSSSYHPVGYLCHKAAEALESQERPSNVVLVPQDKLKKMQEELKHLRAERKKWQGFAGRVTK